MNEGIFVALGGGAMLLVGATMLIFGVRAAAKAARAKRSWARIIGHISDSALNGTFGSTVNYPLPDGTVHSFRTPPVRGEVLRKGQEVRLLVNPQNPTEALVQGFARGFAPTVVIAVGGMFVLTALVVVASGLAIGFAEGLPS